MSAKQITSVGYEIEFDRKGEWAKINSPEGVVYDFKLGLDDLLVCPVKQIFKVVLYSKHYTIEQRKRAELVK